MVSADAIRAFLAGPMNRVQVEARRLDKYTGRRFNVFESLGVQEKELRHSCFLASLLDPRGSHGQGDRFLRPFLEMVGCKVEPATDLCATQVMREFNVVSQSQNNTGRIDLVLQLPNRFFIAIENKVWAGEQENQVGRYQECVKDNTPAEGADFKGCVVFLSVGRRDPGTKDTKSDVQVCAKSYRALAEWLKTCCGRAVDHEPLPPRIEQSVRMYIETCNTLEGGGPMVDKGIEDVVRQNLETALAVQEAMDEIRPKIIWTFWEEVRNLIGSNKCLGSDWKTTLESNVEETHSKLWIEYKKSKREGVRYAFAIEGLTRGTPTCLGIWHPEGITDRDKALSKESARVLKGYKQNMWWIGYKELTLPNGGKYDAGTARGLLELARDIESPEKRLANFFASELVQLFENNCAAVGAANEKNGA